MSQSTPYDVLKPQSFLSRYLSKDKIHSLKPMKHNVLWRTDSIRQLSALSFFAFVFEEQSHFSRRQWRRKCKFYGAIYLCIFFPFHIGIVDR